MTYLYRRLGIVYEIPDMYITVLRLLLEIPRGKVTTYGEIAAALGDKIASRAVGYVMASNPRPDIFPCYKVVNSDGSVGKYSLGKERKAYKLRRDGIRIFGGKIAELDRVLMRWDEFEVFPVLRSLQRLQNELADMVDLNSEVPHVEYIATFDLSYIDGPPDISIGVSCLFQASKSELVATSISIIPVFMPYIPTYLAFRELPAILLALESIMEIGRPDILILDGQGILHPRRFGIASHIGVLTNMPSMGIAKSILIGKVAGDWEKYDGKKYAPIIVNDEVLGYIIMMKNHKIIVSPGHKISLEGALKIALGLEWRETDSEPIIMRIPHRIATLARKYLKRFLRGKGQKEITDFFKLI